MLSGIKYSINKIEGGWAKKKKRAMSIKSVEIFLE